MTTSPRPVWIGLFVTLGLALVGAGPAGATTAFMATIEGSQVVPPNNSSCKGMGTFVLSDDETQLSYDIHFDPWVKDEFISHIHELNPPGTPGEIILVEIAAGPDKVGSVTLEAVDVEALRTGRLFVNVHTTSYRMGEVRGFLLPLTPARAATWGALKSIYR